ncbi:MAG: Fe-S protein assembly co-chaperone HscB [Planctomycetes bacterium]|nr:Fe-S protein assembly co-chaperone HscB [Planctomycetota bacterium]
MPDCARCSAALTSALVCEACGALVPGAAAGDPFAVFGLTTAYTIDARALRKRLLKLSRLLHPDFHGTAEAAQRELAAHHSAELNSAHEVLADDCRRADWLVRHLGGPSEQTERAMPQAFLMEVLEWNEALEAARGSAPGSAPRAALGALAADLEAQRRALLQSLNRLLEPLPATGAPALADARRALNALRYIDRAAGEIAELVLGATAPR